MYLAFRQSPSEFRLVGNPPVLLTSPLMRRGKPDPRWTCQSPTTWVTTDVQAAARFRQYASPAAEKVFNRVLVNRYPLPPGQLPGFLDPHQRAGVEWTLTRSRAYLAHAPGAGKTAQAITAAYLSGRRGQALFIVPPSLTLNWEREIHKFMAHLAPDVWPSVSIISDSKSSEFTGWGADFVIVPDSMLTKDWVLSQLIRMRKRFVAVDEASRFKESTAARTIALFGGRTKTFQSPGLIQDARHAVLLDGSPMPNRPMELWAPTYAMAPAVIDFMSQQDFGFRYCGAKMNRFGRWEFKHASQEAELKKRLQYSFMHVVPESALSHPERMRSLVFLADDKRKPEHRAWERSALRSAPHAELARLQKQKSPYRPGEGQGEMSAMRHEIGMAKVSPATRYIRERLEAGESVLVFAWHRDVVFALSDGLKRDWSHGVIFGGTTARDREQALRDFQDERTRLLILNIAAGGRGHNIQRADRIIFVEPSWTDEANKQCEKRASRRGRDSTLPVKSDYLVFPGSIDEAVMSSVFSKEQTVRKVIG